MNPLRRKRQATFSATALAVYLSLNIEVIDDRRGVDYLALPLLSLTRLLMAGWWIQLHWKRVQRHYVHLQKKWQLYCNLADIGWRSVAWSMGLVS